MEGFNKTSSVISAVTMEKKVGGLELNKIHCMDCLEGLKKIPDKSIDLAFIDPPYNVGKDYGVSKDNLPENEYALMMEKVINEFGRITKKGFGIYSDWKQFPKYWKIVPEAEPIIIYKRSTGFIFSNLKIMQHHHVILTTARAIKPVKSLWDDIRVLGEGYLFNEQRFEHPAQTSLKATKRFIEHFSEEGDLVLDCFAGCGTTTIACKELKRNFIGFELNPKFVELANKRLSQKTLSEVANNDYLVTEGRGQISRVNQL